MSEKEKIQLLFGVLLLLELCLNSCGFSLIDREEALEVPGAGAEAPVPEEAAPKEESSQAEPAPEEPPPDQDPQAEAYILNTNTKKFHRPSCRSAGQIKPKNYEEASASREEVLGRGYSPCGNCKP
jgi:hypothetical protein